MDPIFFQTCNTGKLSGYFRHMESNEYYTSWLRLGKCGILKYEDGTNLIRDESGKPLVKEFAFLYKESKKPKYHLQVHNAREKERDWECKGGHVEGMGGNAFAKRRRR